MTPKQLNAMLLKESMRMMYKPLFWGILFSVLSSYLVFKAANLEGLSFSMDYQMLGFSILLIVFVMILNSLLTIKISKSITIINDIKKGES